MTRARTRFGAMTWNAAAGNPCARPNANDITAMIAIAISPVGANGAPMANGNASAEPAIGTLSDGVLEAPCREAVHPPAAEQDAGRAEHEQDAAIDRTDARDAPAVHAHHERGRPRQVGRDRDADQRETHGQQPEHHAALPHERRETTRELPPTALAFS